MKKVNELFSDALNTFYLWKILIYDFSSVNWYHNLECIENIVFLYAIPISM